MYELFKIQDHWNFEFSTSETQGNMYGRQDWLKIGQDQEIAAVAFFDHRWNQTGKSHMETVALVDLL